MFQCNHSHQYELVKLMRNGNLLTVVRFFLMTAEKSAQVYTALCIGVSSS